MARGIALGMFLNARIFRHQERYYSEERYVDFWASLTEAEAVRHVTICAPVTGDRAAPERCVPLEYGNLEVWPLPWYENSWQLYRRVGRYARAVRELMAARSNRWDVVGAVVPNVLGQLFLRAAADSGVPYFGYVRGDLRRTVYHEFQGLQKTIALAVAALLERTCSGILRGRLALVVGDSLAKRWESKGARAASVVISSVREADLRRNDRQLAENSDLQVLYVGRLSREKGVESLLEAARIVEMRLPGRIKVRIVGDGPERRHLEDSAPPHVSFVGPLPFHEVNAAYSGSDILVLPSHTEGVPKVLLEGLAAGLPVVATAVGGIPGIVTHQREGLLVPPGSPYALADAILDLAADARRRLEMGARAAIRGGELTLEKQRVVVVRLIASEVGV